MKKLILTLLLATLTTGLYWTTEQFIQPTLPQSDQPPLLYSIPGNDDIGVTLAKAIGGAKQSVTLIIYTLSEPRILRALNEKSASGVPVKIVVDGKANPHLPRKLDPKIKLLRRFGRCLMHQKILVIDGSQVFLGSANMTGESLRMHSNLVTGMESPPLASLIQKKADSFEEVGCNSIQIPHQDFIMGGQKLELWFLPDDRGAVTHIKGLIEGARKTLRIAMFTWTRRDFAQAVIDASKRGVKVEVLMDYTSSQGASANIMKFLIQRGIPVRLSQGNGLLHHKLMIVDGQTLVNGSANWTKNAFTQNDDCFLVLHDLTEPQQKQLDVLWTVMVKESAPSKYR